MGWLSPGGRAFGGVPVGCLRLGTVSAAAAFESWWREALGVNEITEAGDGDQGRKEMGGSKQLLRAPLGQRIHTPSVCTAASSSRKPWLPPCVSAMAHGQPALNGKHLSPPRRAHGHLGASPGSSCPTPAAGRLLGSYLVCVSFTQSYLTICDPMDCSPPGSSVPGILQASVLEGLRCRQVLYHCHSVPKLCLLSATQWTAAPGLPCPSVSPGVCSDACPLNQWCRQPSHPRSPPSPALGLSQHQLNHLPVI